MAKTDIEYKKTEFLGRVDIFFENIKEWLNDTKLKTISVPITITEELSGTYDASSLERGQVLT